MSEESDDSAPEDRSNLAGKFYRGKIEKLFRGSRIGVVRSASGREVPFEFLHVSMVGPLRSYDDLREGMAVGFDVGWTANGLRVTVLRAGGAEEESSDPGDYSVPEEPQGDT